MISLLILFWCVVYSKQECTNSSFIIEKNRKIENRELLIETAVFTSLQSCADFCRKNLECRHFEFTSNLKSFNCSIFSSTDYPAIVPDASMTLASKICFQTKCRKQSFAFEKFNNRQIADTSLILHSFNSNIDLCLQKCHEHGNCYGAFFNRNRQMCQLTTIGVNYVYNPRLFFIRSDQVDFYENNCVEFPVMATSSCTFMRMSGGGLPDFSDQRVRMINSFDECEQLCLARANIGDMCRSYTYDKSSQICHLMHSSTRIANRSPLENMDDNLFHGDLDDCIHFSLKCHDDRLEIKTSTIRRFTGTISTKLENNRQECLQAYSGVFQFTSRFDFNACGITLDDTAYKGLVYIKEGSTNLITIRDKIIKVNCRIHKSTVSSQTVSVHVNNSTRQIKVQPTFELKILDSNETEASVLRVGDSGWIDLNVKNAETDVRVTNLVAWDSRHQRSLLTLVDDEGCVASDVVQQVRRISRGRRINVRYLVEFSSLQFSAADEIVFHAIVETCDSEDCQPSCSPKQHLALDLPRKLMKRHIEPRRFELQADVYKVRGHRVTLIKDNLEEGVIVTKHEATLSTSIQHCVADAACIITLTLAGVQVLLLVGCVLIVIAYVRQWRLFRESQQHESVVVSMTRKD